MDYSIVPSQGRTAVQALYSEGAKESAKKTLKASVYEVSFEKKEAVLCDGLYLIMKSSDATLNEKFIVCFAANISGRGVKISDKVVVRIAALNAIAYSMPGTTCYILSRIAFEAIPSLSSPESSNSVLFDTLNTISKVPGASTFERALAEFGKSISYITTSLRDSEISSIRAMTLKAIQNGLSSPMRESEAICSIARNALPLLSEPGDVKTFLYTVFCFLCDRHDLTPTERTLSTFARNLNPVRVGMLHTGMLDLEIAQAREIVLKSMIAYPYGPPLRILSRIALGARNIFIYEETLLLFLDEVLNTIYGSPFSTAEQRRIVMSGFRTVQNSSLYKEKIKSRVDVLDKICSINELQNTVDSPSAVEVEDDSVFIGELKCW